MNLVLLIYALFMQTVSAHEGFRVGAVDIFPKKQIELNSIKTDGKTLHLVVCGTYVYYPFGPIENEAQLKNGLLKNFSISSKITDQSSSEEKLYFLKRKNSSLVLLPVDPKEEGAIRSYVLKGEIKDTDVDFSDGIKIGMLKSDFLKTFFEKPNNKLAVSCNDIELESCVKDIVHRYHFKENRLESVTFTTDSTF